MRRAGNPLESRGEDPKTFFLHNLPRQRLCGENPKEFLRRMSQRQAAAAQQAAAGEPDHPAPVPEH